VLAIFRALRVGFAGFIRRWLRYRNTKIRMTHLLKSGEKNYDFEFGLAKVGRNLKHFSRCGLVKQRRVSKLPLQRLYLKIMAGVELRRDFLFSFLSPLPNSRPKLFRRRPKKNRRVRKLSRNRLRPLFSSSRVASSVFPSDVFTGPTFTRSQQFFARKSFRRLADRQFLLHSRLRKKRGRLANGKRKSSLRRHLRSKHRIKRLVREFNPSTIVSVGDRLSPLLIDFGNRLRWQMECSETSDSAVFSFFNSELVNPLAKKLFLTTELRRRYQKALRLLKVSESEHLLSLRDHWRPRNPDGTLIVRPAKKLSRSERIKLKIKLAKKRAKAIQRRRAGLKPLVKRVLPARFVIEGDKITKRSMVLSRRVQLRISRRFRRRFSRKKHFLSNFLRDYPLVGRKFGSLDSEVMHMLHKLRVRNFLAFNRRCSILLLLVRDLDRLREEVVLGYEKIRADLEKKKAMPKPLRNTSYGSKPYQNSGRNNFFPSNQRGQQPRNYSDRNNHTAQNFGGKNQQMDRDRKYFGPRDTFSNTQGLTKKSDSFSHGFKQRQDFPSSGNKIVNETNKNSNIKK